MTPYAHIAALIEHWAELPARLGTAWPPLESPLREFLAQYQDAPDDAARELLALQLDGWLEEAAPELLDFLDALSTTDGSERFERDRSWRLPALDHILGRAAPLPIPRYTDIACPRRVHVETARFTVSLRLTEEADAASADAQRVEVLPGVPVRVRLYAPDFELLPGSLPAQEIPLPPEGDSPFATFQLRPRIVGTFRLRFDLAQGGQPVGSASATVEVVAQPVAEQERAPRFAPPLDFSAYPDTPPPDRILTVDFHEPTQRLRFLLDERDGATYRFEQPLHRSPEAEMALHYQSLAALARRHDPLTQRYLKREEPLGAEEIDAEWREIGYQLWDRLIPPDLKALYAAQRAQWQDRSLLILSYEPSIPWEVLWPNDLPGAAPATDEGPWCLTLCLTRWLHSDPHAEANPHGPRPTLSLRRFAAVAPSYTRYQPLPAAQSEVAQLRALLTARGYSELPCAGASRPALRAFLQEQPYTLLHVAAHGKFWGEGEAPEGALMGGARDIEPLDAEALRAHLQAELPLGEKSFADPEVKQRIRKHRPLFFFNACEVGRLAWGLTGAEGWAATLIPKGASAFIGPLWVANDARASEFSLAFYRALLDGHPLGEAARMGRLAARRAGDPTWLAYSVYGHPHALLAGEETE